MNCGHNSYFSPDLLFKCICGHINANQIHNRVYFTLFVFYANFYYILVALKKQKMNNYFIFNFNVDFALLSISVITIVLKLVSCVKKKRIIG